MAPRLGIGKGEVLVKQQLGRANRAGRRRRGGRADRVSGWRGGGEGGDVADRADAARGANGGGAESNRDRERGAIVAHGEGGAARHRDVNGGIALRPGP